MLKQKDDIIYLGFSKIRIEIARGREGKNRRGKEGFPGGKYG